MEPPESRREDQLQSDFRELLNSKAGRRLFLELFEKCNLLGASFARDAAQTAFNEGTRSPGLWLKEKIEAARPGEFGRLLTEAANPRENLREAENGRNDHRARRDSDGWDAG